MFIMHPDNFQLSAVFFIILQGQLRKAASVLKKARSKSKLPEQKVGVKRKLDATLADETSLFCFLSNCYCPVV